MGVVWIRWRYDQNRNRFLETLAETCAKTRWQVLAWCLMNNHFHLVVETPEPNLVAGMKWLLEQANARPGPGHFGELFALRHYHQRTTL